MYFQSNVLISNEHNACLTDFGLSRILAEFEGTSYWSSTVGGALRWRAPELLPRQDDPVEEDDTEKSKESGPVLTFECDVYSFGCVMLQASLTAIDIVDNYTRLMTYSIDPLRKDPIQRNKRRTPSRF